MFPILDGYRTIAIEQEFDHTALGKKSKDDIPRALDLTELKLEFAGKLTLLNRLTIIYQDPVIVHTMVRKKKTNGRELLKHNFP